MGHRERRSPAMRMAASAIKRTLFSEYSRKEIFHRIPRGGVGLTIVLDRHIELFPCRGRCRIGERMCRAVIPDERIVGADGVHLFFEFSYHRRRRELIRITVTHEYLGSQDPPGRRRSQQAAMKTDDPFQIVPKPDGIEQDTPAETITDGADLRGVDNII